MMYHEATNKHEFLFPLLLLNNIFLKLQIFPKLPWKSSLTTAAKKTQLKGKGCLQFWFVMMICIVQFKRQ